MASEYNFPFLHAYKGGKAEKCDGCLCVFALGRHRTTLNIQGKDGHEPLPGQGQLLSPSNKDTDICTKDGGVGEVSSSRAPPFADFKRVCLA